MEVTGQLQAPASLTHRKKTPGTHLIGGWLGPKSVWKLLEYREIFCLCPMYWNMIPKPSTPQPHYYSTCTIPAPLWIILYLLECKMTLKYIRSS